MKPTTRIALTFLTTAGLLTALPAMSMLTSNLPAEKTQGSVTYLSGGIGHEEAVAMRHAESKYPLSLEFIQRAKPKDEFLANVNVTIKGHAGNTALETTSEGPFLLAKLPAGKYTVTAEESGKTKSRQVNVAAQKPLRVVFEW